MASKKCGKKPDKGSKVCAGRGEAEKSAKKENRTVKIVITVVAAVVLLAALVWVIYYGVTGGFLPRENNIHYKDSYTVKDNKAVAAMDTVVATLGDAELTNGELQIFYMMQIYEFMTGSYDEGFVASTPLSEQIKDEATGTTWEQYFLDTALTAWARYTVLINQAEAEGYQIPEDYADALAGMDETMQTTAEQMGFETIDAMLQADMGATSSYESYVNYLEKYYRANLYFASRGEEFPVSDEELQTYFTENEEQLEENKITKDSGKLVDVRHILVMPEGATQDTILKETFSDDAWAAGEKEAQAILDEWLAGDKTEASFAELAKEHSADAGSNTNGGLYTYVTKGKMVEAFDEWCFDESRQAGDYGIVKTEYGYHIMYYSYGEEAWIRYCTAGVMREKADAWLVDAVANSGMETDYTLICLSAGDLT